MNTLEQARKKINQIDEKMAALFEERLKAVAEVGNYKREHKLPILDIQREQQVITHNSQYLQNQEFKPYYTTFMQNLMAIAKEYQKALTASFTIGFQGMEGSFSQIALKKAYPTALTKNYTTFEDVFRAVSNGEISLGILPFENSYAGEVGGILDLLYANNCLIQEIYDLKIDHNLLGLEGSTPDTIRQVYSHPQAFAQTKAFLDSQNYQLIPLLNTAAGAKLVAEEKNPTYGAIASLETAKLYNLKVLVKNINNSNENTTRFIIICPNQQESVKALSGNRFSLLFTLNHDVGKLATAIAIIGKHGFNLESIRSKPLHQKAWQYYFYVEIIGNYPSTSTAEMLAELESYCQQLKLIGIYNKET